MFDVIYIEVFEVGPRRSTWITRLGQFTRLIVSEPYDGFPPLSGEVLADLGPHGRKADAKRTE